MNLDKKKKHFILFLKKREKKLLTCIDPALVFLFSKGMLHFALLAANSLSINQLLPTISITEDNNWLQSQSVLVWLSVKARVQSISPSMFQSNFSIALNQSSFFFTMCFPDG
jgi:hypothetical protein